MGGKIGIDVGGTFTDFFVVLEGRAPIIHKVLTTTKDPSIAFVQGLEEIAAGMNPSLPVEEFARSLDTIVHGTTVTTNATLTGGGALTGLLTTEGVRDALEMRRGIREEQYNNRYTNVKPLVPRYLRMGVKGRLDGRGNELTPLNLDDVRDAIGTFKAEHVEAVAICFMNAFADPSQEKQAAELVRSEMPGAYLTVSSDLLPSIRFYDRVSSTVLNSYVGPILSSYLERLQGRLRDIAFPGVLLIMQSNGGVMSPELARDKASLTLLSGPAAGPGAGQVFARLHGKGDCITIDMGGTSFDAALVNESPVVANEGEINRYRIALPMLDIHTIGSGGGSIGWIDEGGLLRMGPHNAGADPGPACYGKGGTEPACTDADLVLDYLDADFFAGGKIRLHRDAAEKAISDRIAQPMGLSLQEAAAGMYRIISGNMARGVREVTIKRGFDPREFPMVVAGGAGGLHACMIGEELGIPLMIVPRESSIFCAAGMLRSDLMHDFVRTFVANLDTLDWRQLERLVSDMMARGEAMLVEEKIPEERRGFTVKFDCRYIKQYHEVSFPISLQDLRNENLAPIARAFHDEHNRLFGYELEARGTPIELINVRVQALGTTDKPQFAEEVYAGADASAALKGEREIYLTDARAFRTVQVYDGHAARFGHRFTGPALIEQVNSTLFLSPAFDCVCDSYGSYAVYLKGREDLVAQSLEEPRP